MTNAAASKTRTIKVPVLSRVEGEGALDIKLKGDRVTDVKLRIFEPPRMFEAFLRGRHFSEVPDIVARICGICPIAYQMSAVHAIERALGVTVSPPIRALRRLFYCGEWLESHALHVFFLHAPDFLGYPDALEMGRDHRELVESALKLKKIGNHIVTLLGGREVHPVSACAGGFYRVPSRTELVPLVEDVKWALDEWLRVIPILAHFEFPDFEVDYNCVALTHPEEYPLNEGRLKSSSGLDLDAAEYDDHFVEMHARHSNALQSVIRGGGSYLVGPLARFNLNRDRLTPAASEAAGSCGLAVPCRNPFKSLLVRAVECVFACEEALRIIENYEQDLTPRAPLAQRAGAGWAITEAPRGILYHHYTFDEHGLIRHARIVPPTSQNQKRIEDDLWQFAAKFSASPVEELTLRCEQAVRNYDPCISCATHAIRTRVERE